MMQLFQNLTNGATELVDVPCPKCIDGNVLISSRCSLISSGTERMLVDFGKANYIDKARQQPEKVKLVLDKIKTDGLLPTIDAVRSKLDQPLPLGYCNAGVVIESRVEGINNGDRVVSNGHHAEVVRVPKNLCAKIPDTVSDEAASFTVLAAIGLQGIRLIKPTIGECFVVSGLGMIGLLCVQLLKANGCRVLGIDYDSSRCKIARMFGAQTVDLSIGENPISIAHSFSRGRGVDGVIVAAASQSNEIMHQSAQICRQRGRIVLVGVVGLKLRRDDFFQKEISFQVSASYGPGRYDTSYEEKGQDYPVGFVRWTEQRNFEAVLDMMASGVLKLEPLISKRFEFNDASNAYELLNDSSILGVLLKYPQKNAEDLTSSTVLLKVESGTKRKDPQNPVIGFLGAGNYASRILIPAFKKTNATLKTIVTDTGASGVHHGFKMGFESASTDVKAVYKEDSINTVVIVTRHDKHVDQVISALKAGKNVFVEKPLALSLDELDKIIKVVKDITEGNLKPPRLMVGFNRRFAPHIVKMRTLLQIQKKPKTIIITVNAGKIPRNHWTQDKKVGGGRIIGEGCHFIDLMRYLVGHPIVSYNAMMIGESCEKDVREDKATINLTFSDGSFGAIHYLANGGKSFPKERVEVFCGDAVLQMNNFRTLLSFDWPGFKKMRLLKQDKGQADCAKAFVDSINDGNASPIPFDELIEVSKVAIQVSNSLCES